MRTKRFVVQMMMMAALAVATEGVMPAPNCSTCKVVPNIHTYDEQSSIGNLLDVVWTWFESVVLPIL
jgi:hypothetical protein